MRSKTLSDLQDPFADLFSDAGDGFCGIFSPPGSHGGEGSSTSVPVSVPTLVIPEEAVEAQAAQNGSGGVNSVVAATSGGLAINLIFDATAMAAPASFRAGIQQAAAILSG